MEGSFQERTDTFFSIPFIIIPLLAIFDLGLIRSGIFDLSPLEAHYWEWARRLDLSYYSKPPMVAYIIALSTSVFGDNEIGVRIGAVVLSVFTAILFLLLCGQFNLTSRARVYSFLFLSLSPMFFGGSILMTTDIPLVFFWVLAIYSMRRALREERLLWWILTGIALGGGLISKYTMFFFIPCVILYLLITGRFIRIIKNPHPWISIALALMIMSPVIYWNYRHDWVSFRHTAGLAVRGREIFTLSPKYFAEFLGSQIALLSPLIFFMIISGWIKGFVDLSRRRDDEDVFLLSFSLPIFLFFLLLSLHGKTQGNWPSPCYITAYIYVSKVFDNGLFFNPSKRRLLTISALVTASLMLVFTYSISIISEYMDTGINPKLNISNRLKGWKELSREVSRIKKTMDKKNVFIFSDDYNISSELAFYMESHPVTYCVNLGRRMNQYDLWEDFSALKGWDAIYVTKGDSRFPEPLRYLFDGYSKELFEVKRGGALIKVFSIFRCYNFHGGMPVVNRITY